MRFPVTIHDPDVVLTDLGLALLGAWFAWRLVRTARGGPLEGAPALLMAGLASAAFWGAIFHAFFPENTATLPGFIAWIPVTLSIVVAAAIAVMWFTEAGRTFLAFARESWEEAKRVVWPTRKETLQTTGVVFLFVFTMAIFLWMVDSGLLWVTQKVLGTGG